MFVDGEDYYGETTATPRAVFGVPGVGLEGEVQSIKNKCSNRSVVVAFDANIVSEFILRREDLERQPPFSLAYPFNLIIREQVI